jgi:hypothetical protein
MQPASVKEGAPRCDASATSERRLNHRVTTIRTMRANLKKRTGLPVPDEESTPQSHEERKRLMEEAERKAIERELSNYMTEPCHFEGTDAEYETILAYWSVRDFQNTFRYHG